MSGDGSPSIRFTVRLPQTFCVANPKTIAAAAETAEELGFWGVSVQDHLVADTDVSFCGDSHSEAGDDRVVFEALQTLAFVGARTKSVKLLAGVLITPFRHAVLLAKEIASLDVFTGGRLIVGTGIGAPVHVKAEGRHNMTGHGRIAQLEYDAYGVKGHFGRRANEALQVMEAIWTDGAASFHGEFYDFDDLAVYPKPLQRPRPPLWVGGRSEFARRRVLTYADAWFPSQMSPSRYEEGKAWMSAYAADHGLAMPRDFGVNIFAAIDTDSEKAEDAYRRTFGPRFDSTYLDRVMLAGNPDRFIARCQEYAAAGVNVFDVKLTPPTLEENIRQMRLISEEVMPAFAG